MVYEAHSKLDKCEAVIVLFKCCCIILGLIYFLGIHQTVNRLRKKIKVLAVIPIDNFSMFK